MGKISYLSHAYFIDFFKVEEVSADKGEPAQGSKFIDLYLELVPLSAKH